MEKRTNTIDRYDFSKIVVSGKEFTRDLIIYPDKVVDDWWRVKGHELCVKDIEGFVNEWKPDVLVVGTGYYGRVKILPETEAYLKSKKIDLVAEDTSEACKTFNRMKHMKVVAALHLTC